MNRATVVIPTFNHAAYLADAVESALVQTEPCDVIVVDDGSTDQTASVLSHYADHVTVITLPHGGPSQARNAGIDAAQSEFVMLLDADDVIAPNKVERQIAEFSDEIGWVLCDVRIEDSIRGVSELASERYRYAQRELGGWIRPQLAASNFIPIMSPLVRRSVLADNVRFGDLLPEDWHFWYRVAAHARVRYIPDVLATYRKHRNGRNTTRHGVVHVSPESVPGGPLLLNLGCGTQGTPSWHPMPGCVNLDRSMGWCFEDGLPQYADGAVDAITISHTLMYVDERDWPSVVGEFYRALKPGGIVRITEDVTDDLESARCGGWKGSEPAVTLTSQAFVAAHLEAAGFVVLPQTATTTAYGDHALLQAQHGAPPNVFFIEGRKPGGVLFSPHSDDETLFAAYTIQRHHPAVVVCFGSSGDYGDTSARETETRSAVGVLGGGPVEQWHGGDLVADMRAYDARRKPTRVWAPDARASHPDHVAVAKAAREVFGSRVSSYHTYDANGKVRAGTEVPYEPRMVGQKLRALAHYETQHSHPRACKFFADDLREYAA